MGLILFPAIMRFQSYQGIEPHCMPAPVQGYSNLFEWLSQSSFSSHPASRDDFFNLTALLSDPTAPHPHSDPAIDQCH
jgi:hypothetical protein